MSPIARPESVGSRRGRRIAILLVVLLLIGLPLYLWPLHGGIEGSGLYVTRTELHELLAQAFAAAGARDSAAAHWAVVERAWRGADPALQARYETARSGALAARSRP